MKTDNSLYYKKNIKYLEFLMDMVDKLFQNIQDNIFINYFKK